MAVLVTRFVDWESQLSSVERLTFFTHSIPLEPPYTIPGTLPSYAPVTRSSYSESLRLFPIISSFCTLTESM